MSLVADDQVGETSRSETCGYRDPATGAGLTGRSVAGRKASGEGGEEG